MKHRVYTAFSKTVDFLGAKSTGQETNFFSFFKL